ARRMAYLERLAAVREGIPASAHQVGLDQVGLSERVLSLLTEAGYESAAAVMQQLGMDSDRILSIDGFGPKAMEEVQLALSSYAFPMPEPEVEAPAAEPEAEAGAGAGVEGLEVLAETAEAEQPLAGEPGAVGEAEAAPPSLEATFEAVSLEISQAALAGAAEEEDEQPEAAEAAGGKKKKKRKKGALEFDPASGTMVVRKRRKPGRTGWGDDYL
ncbi:MAG: hypothetical protein MUO23_15295, partial [Anaerolineales bacterium]|nr:hypothetical protein [Anaerolineales bacterium]